ALPLRLLLPVAHEVTVDEDPPGLDLLELVDAPQEGRLARPGRPEQADDLSGRDVEVDALEHLGGAEGLAHLDGVDEWPGHLAPPIVRPMSLVRLTSFVVSTALLP